MPIKVKSLRETSRVTLFFVRPILDWREVYGRFFRMINEGFQEKIRIEVSDFSASPNIATMGDLRARWSIYGGSSSVTLLADRIEFDFPVLLPTDFQLAWLIMRTVHDLLPKTFEEWHYNRIESNTFEHLELPSEISVSRYLAGHGRPEVARAFADTKVVYEPGAKFRLISEDGSWEIEVGLDKSVFNAAAIFVARTLKLNRIDSTSPFEEKVERAQSIVKRAMIALDLEYNGVGT